MPRTKRNRSSSTQENSSKRKRRNPPSSFDVVSEHPGTSGVKDSLISDMVPLTKDNISTMVSAVLQSIRSQPQDPEPSVQALLG